MRIQHNIIAMNAYRNYNNNTSAISKNLEKLSSGYKINRAGDDAAGLAVSQKMRLQIAGLAQAQKNAKSGISYIQTAEGALQEVHEMLERMYTLAEQSANGTFDDDTDRVQLQKEINNLMEEIDRIGKTANFNGMGIFAEYAAGGTSTADTYYEATAKIGGTAVTGADAAKVAGAEAKAAVYTYTIGTALDGDTGKDSKIKIANVELTVGKGSGDIDTDVSTDAKAQATAIADKLNDNATFKASYKAEAKNDTVVVTALKAGVDANAADMKANPTITNGGTAGGAATAAETTPGAAAVAEVPAHKTYDLSGTLKAGDEITVNNKKYTFDAAAGADDKTKFKDLGDLKTKLDAAGVTMDTTDNQKVTFKKKADGGDGGNGGGKAIKFWVGAEYSEDNILELKTMNLSSTNMQIEAADVTADAGVEPTAVEAGNLKGVDITSAGKAMKSLELIQNASNAVSDMRGSLGAMQNRLDHTIKNLSVMQENMQDAESVIRDTDVADEMMAYTKNNILIQSAQAMLAQANQIPQGVLQLLQ